MSAFLCRICWEISSNIATNHIWENFHVVRSSFLCGEWERKRKTRYFALERDCARATYRVLTSLGVYRDMMLSACRHQKAANYTLCDQAISV